MSAVSTDLFADTTVNFLYEKHIQLSYYLDAFPIMDPLKNTVGTPFQKWTKIKVCPDTTVVYTAKTW